ncbi:unnamed protein product [Acanthosepion pharaonis]|uniref:Uncharacterized protein n=1 Tax=Acanthosepion pharaonis TaxID=158019 RepID=A0A812BJW1_ACAPH|nr:unnamed protein product [Sepia pharaonis]
MLCLFFLYLHYDRIQGMILSTSSLFYAMSLFLCLHYDRIQGMILITHSSLFYAMSLFSAYIMTGYRDDIKATLPSSMQCLFFSVYIMTGYRDDINHTLPSSVRCLFSLFLTGYRDDIVSFFSVSFHYDRQDGGMILLFPLHLSLFPLQGMILSTLFLFYAMSLFL